MQQKLPRELPHKGARTALAKSSALLSVALLALLSAVPAQAETGLSALWPSIKPQGQNLPDPVAFTVAIELGNVDQARKWLDAGLSPDFMGDHVGTGLMIASWEGNLPMMELFVSRGANIHKTNKVGEDALMMAVWRGNRAAVDWLLARGAKLNRPDMQWSAIHYAAFAGHNELVQLLIDKGANINALTPGGASPLMMAVYENHEATASRLLQLGANPNVRNDYGDSALDWAMRKDNMRMARIVGGENFKEAASRPKSTWRAMAKSEAPPPEIASMLRIREVMAARGMSTKAMDQEIAEARARHYRPQRFAPPPVANMPTIEIRARRGDAQDQGVQVINQPGK